MVTAFCVYLLLRNQARSRGKERCLLSRGQHLGGRAAGDPGRGLGVDACGAVGGLGAAGIRLGHQRGGYAADRPGRSVTGPVKRIAG